MKNYSVNDIDSLRARASLTYEEAIELLERNEGVVARCLVELERQGKVHAAQPQQQAPNGHDHWQAHGAAAKAQTAKMNGFLFAHIKATKGDATILDLPVLLWIVALIFAPHLTFPGILLLFLTGCRIQWKRGAGEVAMPKDFQSFAQQAAQNIRNTADSVANVAKDEGESEEQA